MDSQTKCFDTNVGTKRTQTRNRTSIHLTVNDITTKPNYKNTSSCTWMAVFFIFSFSKACRAACS